MTDNKLIQVNKSNNCLWQITCVFFVSFLFASCTFIEKFPADIDDIDTLTVYKLHLKTISHDTVSQSFADTIQPDSTIHKIDTDLSLAGTWTICAGVFKEKSNAKRLFGELNKSLNTYIVSRDSTLIVSIGDFHSKDSALAFRNKHNLNQTYLMKLRENEKLQSSFPE